MGLTLDQIKTKANDIKTGYSERDKAYEEYEKMYLVEDDGLPDGDWIKDTISPDARNQIQGAIRLMTATDPQFSVPFDEGETAAQEKSDKIEKFANAVWSAAGKIRGRPIHYDAVLSALLYGEVNMTARLTSDVAKLSDPATKARLTAIESKTPLLFDVINPRMCYPVFDSLGLAAHVYSQEMSVADIISRWGDAAKALAGKKLTDKLTYWEYWDYETHAVWLDGADWSMQTENTMGVIPVISVIAEGSNLFGESDQQSRQPFLYTLYKSNLWKRQNVLLTVLYSTVFAIGSNPMFLYKSNTPEKTLDIDWNNPGGVARIDRDEDLTSLTRNVIDPSVMDALTIAQEKITESTIYKQTLGEPLGANAPYSMVSLLSQSGRLPLVPYQRMASFAIGEAMRVGLDMYRQYGADSAIRSSDGKTTVKLSPVDIPENVVIDCKLDIDMPQDKRTDAAIAAQLTSGENPLTSLEWARQNVLGIGQSTSMDKQIWAERMSNIMAQQQMQMMIQQMTQQAQAKQPGQAQGQPQQPGMTQVDPTQQAQQFMAQGQQAQDGLPMTAPKDQEAQMLQQILGGLQNGGDIQGY